MTDPKDKKFDDDITKKELDEVSGEKGNEDFVIPKGDGSFSDEVTSEEEASVGMFVEEYVSAGVPKPKPEQKGEPRSDCSCGDDLDDDFDPNLEDEDFDPEDDASEIERENADLQDYPSEEEDNYS